MNEISSWLTSRNESYYATNTCKKKNTKWQPDQVINWSQPLPPKTGLIRPEKKERRQKASDKPHNLAREKKETLSAEEKGKENSSPLHLKTTKPQLDYEEKGKPG